jgi:hypothetical protein
VGRTRIRALERRARPVAAARVRQIFGACSDSELRSLFFPATEPERAQMYRSVGLSDSLVGAAIGYKVGMPDMEVARRLAPLIDQVTRARVAQLRRDVAS